MIYLKLFWDFFRVSCFTFGGAYGAIPLIRDMVLGNGWISEERFVYMIAVSESTPGPIMVNMATYIGSDQAGFWGSLVATIGVVLPAYLTILLIAGIMRNAIKNKYVQAVLQGLKPCVIGIVIATGTYMLIRNFLGTETVLNPTALLITLLLAAITAVYRLIFKKPLPSIALICVSAVLGVILFSL